MNDPICFVVMRNGHIMPPGIHMHRVNAEATAVKEEGEVVPLYRSPVDAVPVATLSELEAELREEAKAYWKDGDLVGRDIVHRCASRLAEVIKARGAK